MNHDQRKGQSKKQKTTNNEHMDSNNIDLSQDDIQGHETGTKKKKTPKKRSPHKSNSESQDEKTPPKKAKKIPKEKEISAFQQKQGEKCLVSVILDSVYAASYEGNLIKDNLRLKDRKVFESTSMLKENPQRFDPNAPLFPVKLCALLCYHYLF